MTQPSPRARLAVDIGGTFTDVTLEVAERRFTRKVLTTASAPEQGVVRGVLDVMPESGLEPGDVGIIIHGTTLATNAIIERKGAKTALLVTEGFRDSVEMAYENRFEQYDIDIDKPAPLVPRYLRWPVKERMNARGEVLIPLDEGSVRALIPELEAHGIESVAVGFLHSYANQAHEQRAGEILRAALPRMWLSLSSEVCPEIREYERLSTTCANAYVRPLMARYLINLERELRQRGFACPLLMMMSSGALTTLETATKFPIRLVESGPAGGAILASHIAGQCALARVLSFDMGGTTAKICLIDDAKPQTARSFEIAHVSRFTEGSGLPVRIPAIDMVEIGAGGGSIARVDSMGRINVGPESAGSEPGPACYDRGGTRPTVTDADVVLGRIDPAAFAGGAVKLAPEKAGDAVIRGVGHALGAAKPLAALGLSEVVDENMANAARVHAIGRGKDITKRALVAFGGAAPLHAGRLAEKLGIELVIVPVGAGVGSAIGFLRAPVAYEVVRSHYMRLSEFDAGAANRLLDGMREEAVGVVRLAAPGEALVESRAVFMRYLGQGHEISVPVPDRRMSAADAAVMKDTFDETYRALYGRSIPGVEIELLTWTVTVGAVPPAPEPAPDPDPVPPPAPYGQRPVFDRESASYLDVPAYRRDDLAPGMSISGPALIVEEQTTTVVPPRFDAKINGLGYILLKKREKRREKGTP